MSEKITRRKLGDRNQGKTDWARLDAMTDEEIMADIADDPDAAPPLDREWFEGATLVVPETMERIALYLDKDVTAWFHAQDPEFGWHVNRALREYAQARGAQLGVAGTPTPDGRKRTAA